MCDIAKTLLLVSLLGGLTACSTQPVLGQFGKSEDSGKGLALIESLRAQQQAAKRQLQWVYHSSQTAPNATQQNELQELLQQRRGALLVSIGPVAAENDFTSLRMAQQRAAAIAKLTGDAVSAVTLKYQPDKANNSVLIEW